MFKGTVAHEFGHTLGLLDAYADDNDGYQIIKRYNDNNPEIEYPCTDKLNANWDPIWSNYDNSTANPPYGFGTKSNGEIMLNNGSATANDIEMVLYSFLENKMQSFTFQSKNQPLSKAIRDKRPVYYKPSDTNYYYYDRINNSFVIIGSINNFIKWR